MKKFLCCALIGVALLITGCGKDAIDDESPSTASMGESEPVSDNTVVADIGNTVDPAHYAVEPENPVEYWWDNFDNVFPEDKFSINVILQGASANLTKVGNDFSCSLESADLTCAFASIGGVNYYSENGGWKRISGDIDLSQYFADVTLKRDAITSMNIATKDNGGLDEFSTTLGVDAVNIGFSRQTGNISYIEFANNNYVYFEDAQVVSVDGLIPAVDMSEISASEVSSNLQKVHDKISEVL